MVLLDTVTATKGSDTVKLTVRNKTAYKNGSKIELDVPAKVINGDVPEAWC
ncbi:stalk domain-containing protein [Calorimonas adulescens]|jgi:Copper amine oxidase N-terminal domain.|uniref:Copper amine oxidase N-terminal domain-containing protein n=1 Tax=Calorimonas adulescens TaxID=2606906 RepID=A0A5D8QEQ9_9THEO|nr:stalk domain-containing protein [Calorimonas adulescens]TZE82992.1 copper amine oxidase N-terminal domain-containing protein [Calorimonas adulescens]